MKEVALTHGQVVTVDDEDHERVSQFKWRAQWYSYEGYFVPLREQDRYGDRKIILLSRFIMNAPSGLDVDHKNHNHMDCTRVNLRVCTRAENLANQIKQRRSCSSRFKGVSWLKHIKRWMAYITKDGQRIYLGVFKNEEDAAYVYDTNARKLFGAFAYLNFS